MGPGPLLLRGFLLTTFLLTCTLGDEVADLIAPSVDGIAVDENSNAPATYSPRPPNETTKPMSITDKAMLATFIHHTKPQIAFAPAPDNGTELFDPAPAPVPQPAFDLDILASLLGPSAAGPDKAFIAEKLARAPAPSGRAYRRHSAPSPAFRHFPASAAGTGMLALPPEPVGGNSGGDSSTAAEGERSASPGFLTAEPVTPELLDPVGDEGNSSSGEDWQQSRAHLVPVHLDSATGEPLGLGTSDGFYLDLQPADALHSLPSKPYMATAGALGSAHSMGIMIPLLGVLGLLLVAGSVVWVYTSRRTRYTGLHDLNIEMGTRPPQPK